MSRMTTMTTRNVNEIASAERAALEALLGGKLSSEQQVFVIAYTPAVMPDPDARAAARQRLIKTFEEIDRNGDPSSVSEEEADATIKEAMERDRQMSPKSAFSLR